MCAGCYEGKGFAEKNPGECGAPMCRSSANGPDVRAVRPVGDVRWFSFRSRRSVWFDIYGGGWGCWKFAGDGARCSRPNCMLGMFT